jgi:hypothetical protein
VRSWLQPSFRNSSPPPSLKKRRGALYQSTISSKSSYSLPSRNGWQRMKSSPLWIPASAGMIMRRHGMPCPYQDSKI